MEKETTSAQIRKIQLYMLDEVDRLCKKHNIKYYLIGGTLLGAVRHKGYIPWDDDIDICMLREDYKKFEEVCKTELDSAILYQSKNTEKKYWTSFNKLRMKNTTFASGATSKMDVNRGIFLDIFPIDNAFDVTKRSGRFLIRLQKKLVLKANALRAVKATAFQEKTFWKKLVSFVFMPVTNRMIGDFADFIMQLKKHNVKYYVGLASSYSVERQTVPKDVYGEPSYVEFEGRTLPAPADWDAFLTNLYGDYMTPPPASDRTSRHNIVKIEVDKA